MGESFALTEATYYILLSLYQPRHGYGIMQSAETLSHGRVHLAPGTLYGALSTLCDRGLIALLPVDEGSRRKDYRLTERGLTALRQEWARLSQMVTDGQSVLGGET